VVTVTRSQFQFSFFEPWPELWLPPQPPPFTTRPSDPLNTVAGFHLGPNLLGMESTLSRYFCVHEFDSIFPGVGFPRELVLV